MHLHEFNLQLVALPELQGMFSDPSSYQLLMSLLYKHELYNEILDIMTMITTGRCLHLRYPRTCVMISLAAALKLVSILCIYLYTAFVCNEEHF